MEDHAYTAAHITVLSFEDVVRKRTGTYFGVAPDSQQLATNIVRAVIDDALHPVGGGRHQIVTVEVVSDLRFAVSDDQRHGVDDQGQLRLGFFDSLIDRSRWALAGAAAISTRSTVEVWSDGRGYRQELVGTRPTGDPVLVRGEGCVMCSGKSFAELATVRDLR
jgi:hypothetical protein